ncbi:MAG: hypothetical protein WAM11_04735 [Cyanobium sp.]
MPQVPGLLASAPTCWAADNPCRIDAPELLAVHGGKVELSAPGEIPDETIGKGDIETRQLVPIVTRGANEQARRWVTWPGE